MVKRRCECGEFFEPEESLFGSPLDLDCPKCKKKKKKTETKHNEMVFLSFGVFQEGQLVAVFRNCTDAKMFGRVILEGEFKLPDIHFHQVNSRGEKLK